MDAPVMTPEVMVMDTFIITAATPACMPFRITLTAGLERNWV